MPTRRTTVDDLPPDVFRVIQEYVEIIPLLQTCQSLYALKKEIYNFKLSKPSSVRFFKDTMFRDLVLSHMTRAASQLLLDCNREDIYHHLGKEVQAFSFNLRRSRLVLKDISALSSVHTLDLGLCGWLSKVESLSRVHTLCMKSTLFDLSCLGALGHVHSLDLSYNEKISDVSALGKVHTLQLKHCNLVSDVACLSGVHTLDLSLCELVRDVSALGNVHQLNLRGCSKVDDVRALGAVHSLDLSGCLKISDVSQLGRVCRLKLRYCTAIEDVSALSRVRDLDLGGCVGVTDVSTLTGVHTLNLNRCTGVTNVAVVRDVVHRFTDV